MLDKRYSDIVNSTIVEFHQSPVPRGIVASLRNFARVTVDKLAEPDGTKDWLSIGVLVADYEAGGISFDQSFSMPDDITFEDVVLDFFYTQELLSFAAALQLGERAFFYGVPYIWFFRLVNGGWVSQQFIATIVDTFFEEIVIKEKQFQLTGKGVIDVGTQLDIRKNNEVWLWRGHFECVSLDESVTDPQFSNPERHYLGLCTFSNFGHMDVPTWIRTKNYVFGTFMVLPNYSGKSLSQVDNYPNLQYQYPRFDRIIYDLRPKVSINCFVTAVRFMFNLETWW